MIASPPGLTGWFDEPAVRLDLLRRGEIDVALAGHVGRAAEREFYTRRLVALPLVAILPADHPLRERTAGLPGSVGQRASAFASARLPKICLTR